VSRVRYHVSSPPASRLSDEETDEPLDAALARAVVEGFSAPQKTLSSAWFYDDEGSRLFQEIMALDAYYLTRTEHGILRSRGDELARRIAPDARPVDLIELGSGDGEKTLSICEALVRHGADCVFRPMDISPHALEELSRRFSEHLPGFPVQPLCGDYFLNWPATVPGRRQVAMFLGSNLGNQTHDGAIALLRRMRAHLQPGDALVLGLDLKKDPHVIRAAYDDPEGVTARFNMNLLTRLNRELGMDFDLDQFSHYATYSPLDGAARSFLVSRRRQIVHSRRLACDFAFQAGETIYTEQSQKYSQGTIDAMARESGFDVQCHFTDERGWYTVVVWQAVDATP
jgi:dimethylhistidine N-methyltransferase